MSILHYRSWKETPQTSKATDVWATTELNLPFDSAPIETDAMTEESDEFPRILADSRGVQVIYSQTLSRSSPGLGPE